MVSWLLALALWAPPGFADAWRQARDPQAPIAPAEAALKPFTTADPDTAGRAWFALGALAERRGDPAAAEAAYAASLRADPGGRFAARADARQRALGRRPRADRAVLADFDRIRRDYLRLGKATARAQVAALFARAQTEPVKAELRLWQAEDAFAAADAPAALRVALEAAEWPAAQPLLVRRAVELALRAAGPSELGRVKASLDRLGQARPELVTGIDLPRLADEISDRKQRRVARWLAWAALALFAVAVLAARPWQRWRQWRPLRGLVFLAWAFGGAALLAQQFEHGYGWVVGAAGAGAVPVYLATSLAAAGARKPWVGLLAVPATLGALFLVLDRLGQAALMGM